MFSYARFLFLALTLVIGLCPTANATITPWSAPTHEINTQNQSPAVGRLTEQLRLLVNQPGGLVATPAQDSAAVQTLVPAPAPSLLAIPQPTTTAVATAADQDTADDAADLIPNFGTRLLNVLMAAGDVIYSQLDTVFTNFSALPQLSDWINQQQSNSKIKTRWISLGNDFLVAVLPAIAVFVFVEILLIPARNKFRDRAAPMLLERVEIIGILFLLRMLTISVAVATAVAILDHNETQKIPRYLILNVVYALALSRVLLITFRAILAPAVEHLRLLPLNNKQAKFSYLWLAVFAHVIIYGYLVIDLAKNVRMPSSAIGVFTNILALVIIALTICVIFQIRGYVAYFLQGKITKPARDRTPFEGFRIWFGRYWHILAVTYLLIGYVFTALNVQNGFMILLRGTILTLLIILTTRLLLYAVYRWSTRGSASPGIHKDIMSFLFKAVIWVASASAIGMAWGADLEALLSTSFGKRLSGSAFSLLVTIGTLVIAYEFLSSSIDRHINRRGEDGLTPYASARTRTLLPMVRNTVFCIFAAVAIIVGLSEAGLNIAPLLAGAGVLGVAVGFGSQTLVKDFLTGLFIVIENTIAVGDVVQIGTHSGVVEGMSIRTIRIRDQDGNLHILPFSETTNVINMTRGFGYAVFKIGVAYDTDLEHASDVMRAIGEELQEDPVFKYMILDPIEISGVDSLGDYAITLLARIRTRPGKQWDVKRRYLLNLKKRFEMEGIEIPFPTSTQIHRPHQASSPEDNAS